MSNTTGIHTGFWINHNSPPALGATFTISIRLGNYLIAILSSLVAWAGSRAWSLLLFYLHQRSAARPDKDILDQQLQVLYRSPSSIFDTIIDTFNLQRAWKGRARRVRVRTVPVLVLAVIFFSLFIAAGVLVAEVASKSYENVIVLAKPLDCGDLWYTGSILGNATAEDMTGWFDFEYTKTRDARAYAALAYNKTLSQYQSSFVKPTVEWMEEDVECPWTINTTCLGPNRQPGPALRLDTGLMDSHEVFGINAPKKDRVSYHRAVTCGVLDPTNLTTPRFTDSSSYSVSDVNATYVGVRIWSNDDVVDNMALVNLDAQSYVTGYYAQRYVFEAMDGDIPSPTFNVNDADTTIMIFTQGFLQYYKPVDDPLFLAQKPMPSNDDVQYYPDTVYVPEAPFFGLMACHERMQLCNPNNGLCTALSSDWAIWQETQKLELGLNSAQLVTAARILQDVEYFGQDAANGQSGIAAADYGSNAYGHTLPADHWKSEVHMWFATHLSRLQMSFQTWARKPWTEPGKPTSDYAWANLKYLNESYSKRPERMVSFNEACHNQMVRASASVQNYSVLATSIVIVFSLAIIITAACVPPCVSSHRQRRIRKGKSLSQNATAKRLARFADEKFHLLYMSLQGSGVDDWELGKAQIPVTVEASRAPQPVEEQGIVHYPVRHSSLLEIENEHLKLPEPFRIGIEREDSTLMGDDSIRSIPTSEELVIVEPPVSEALELEFSHSPVLEQTIADTLEADNRTLAETQDDSRNLESSSVAEQSEGQPTRRQPGTKSAVV